MRIRIFLFFTVLNFTFLSAQGLKAEGKKIVDKNGNEVLLRGMGLGGWMLMEGYMMQSSDVADTQHEFRERLEDLMGIDKTNAFFDKWLENHVTKADIDSLSAWGFNSVRLPMHYNLFTLPIEKESVEGENTWLDKGFTIVDSRKFIRSFPLYLENQSSYVQPTLLSVFILSPNILASTTNLQQVSTAWEKNTKPSYSAIVFIKSFQSELLR